MKLEVSFRKVSFSFKTMMHLSTQNRPTCNEIRGYESFESWYLPLRTWLVYGLCVLTVSTRFDPLLSVDFVSQNNNK